MARNRWVVRRRGFKIQTLSYGQKCRHLASRKNILSLTSLSRFQESCLSVVSYLTQAGALASTSVFISLQPTLSLFPTGKTLALTTQPIAHWRKVYIELSAERQTDNDTAKRSSVQEREKSLNRSGALKIKEGKKGVDDDACVTHPTSRAFVSFPLATLSRRVA